GLGEARLEVERLLLPGDRFIVSSSGIEGPWEPCGDLRIQRIELVRAPGLGERLLRSSVRREAVRVEIVGIGKAGIQLNGPPQFALRRQRVLDGSDPPLL